MSVSVFVSVTCTSLFFVYSFFFFFNDTATTEIYTLSLHDALPIYVDIVPGLHRSVDRADLLRDGGCLRSEEHTSELQSRRDLVCRLLLEKKKKITITTRMRQHRTADEPTPLTKPSLIPYPSSTT